MYYISGSLAFGLFGQNKTFKVFGHCFCFDVLVTEYFYTVIATFTSVRYLSCAWCSTLSVHRQHLHPPDRRSHAVSGFISRFMSRQMSSSCLQSTCTNTRARAPAVHLQLPTERVCARALPVVSPSRLSAPRATPAPSDSSRQSRSARGRAFQSAVGTLVRARGHAEKMRRSEGLFLRVF